MNNFIQNITQLAVVTPNADSTMRELQQTLGLGAFKVWDFRYPRLFATTRRDRAEPWSMKLGITWVGDMQIEVIEPTGGDSLYQKFLDQKKAAGLQHILVDRGRTSYQEAKTKLAELGFPVAQEGKTNVAAKVAGLKLKPLPMFLAKRLATTFGYTDTFDSLKISLEVSKFPPGLSARRGLRFGLPDAWVGPSQYFEKLPPETRLSKITKVYIVVANLDETIPHWQKLARAPLSVSETIIHNVKTNSEEKVKLACLNLKDSEIVLLEPLSNNTIFAKLLTERGEGAHFVGAVTPDKDKNELINHFQAKGFSLEATAQWGKNESHYFYHPRLPFNLEAVSLN